MHYEPQHLRESSSRPEIRHDDQPDGAGLTEKKNGTSAHPLGIPIPEDGSGAEFIPLPGDTQTNNIAVNGAIVRNPWADQPEILPDHEYTPEQEDLNLIQL